MDLNRMRKVSRHGEKTREARAWTSQRWALSEAQVRRWPEMTAGLGQPRSPLCPLERTMDSPYSPLFRRRETLLLHGVPPLTLQWQLEDIVSTRLHPKDSS